MILYRVLGLICAVIFMALASPVPLADDGFDDFLQNGLSKVSALVKRRIFEDNTDRQLKEISLSSLLGDLEKNIFASALSFNKVFTNKKVSVPEIKVNDDSEHDVNKCQSLAKEEKNSESTAKITTTTTEPSVIMPVNAKAIFETAEKVAQTNAVPTHIVIDRIAIEPHSEGLGLIPTFELKHNRRSEDANTEHEITKSTTSKIEIASSVNEPGDPSSSYSSTSSYTSNSMSVASTTTTTEAALKTVTTSKNIEQLKEAEEELKEKFAEIEAEPIILSARV